MEEIQVSVTFTNVGDENRDAFKARLSDLVEKTKAEGSALRYDAYFSEDGSQCVLLETYSDSATLLGHLQHVGEDLGPLIELGGGVEVEVFGNPSDELNEAIAPMNPVVHRHIASIPHGGEKLTRGPEQIDLVVSFGDIPDGNQADVEAAMRQLVEATSGEEAAVRYDAYMREDGGRAVVREIYPSSEAVLGHLQNVGDKLGPLVETAGGIDVQVYGDRSPELIAAGEAFAPTPHSFFAGA